MLSRLDKDSLLKRLIGPRVLAVRTGRGTEDQLSLELPGRRVGQVISGSDIRDKNWVEVVMLEVASQSLGLERSPHYLFRRSVGLPQKGAGFSMEWF